MSERTPLARDDFFSGPLCFSVWNRIPDLLRPAGETAARRQLAGSLWTGVYHLAALYSASVSVCTNLLRFQTTTGLPFCLVRIRSFSLWWSDRKPQPAELYVKSDPPPQENKFQFQVHIKTCPALVRLGFMHVFAANICIWTHTLVREVLDRHLTDLLHQYADSDTGEANAKSTSKGWLFTHIW